MAKFPRGASPKDPFGFPHYENIKRTNIEYENDYIKTLIDRRNQRAKKIKDLKGLQKEKYLLKHRKEIASLFSLNLSSSLPKNASLRIDYRTTFDLSKAQIRKTKFSIYSKDIQVGEFIEFRQAQAIAPPPSILCLPDTGPGLSGVQSADDIFREYAYQLLRKNNSIIVPQWASLKNFSSTKNKELIFEGSHLFAEAIRETSFILDVLPQISGLDSHTTAIAAKGFGASVGLILNSLDSRLNNAILYNPIYIGHHISPEALHIPRFNAITDMGDIIKTGLNKNISILRPNQEFKKIIAINKQIKHSNDSFIQTILNRKNTRVSAEKKYYIRPVIKDLRKYDIAHIASKAKAIQNTKVLKKEYIKLLDVDLRSKAISNTLVSETDMGAYDRQEYHVQTGENTLVNMTLCIPKTDKKKLPAVLCLPGSGSDVQKNWERYAFEVVEKGWIAVSIDARVALYDFHPDIMEGNSVIVQSIKDIIFCTNLIFQRKDIDPKRIATMGISQGATHAWMLTALDERICACAPICGTSTFKAICEEPVDEYYGGHDRRFLDSHSIYYYIPGMRNLAEQQDICSLIAPRHLAVIGGDRDDCFPVSGMREVNQDLQKFYKLIGSPKNFEYHEFNGPHSMPPHSRQKAYKLFEKAFKLNNPTKKKSIK